MHHIVGSLGYPPDLQMASKTLNIEERFKKITNKAQGIMDIDHYSKERTDINFDLINRKLIILQETIKNTFEYITTNYAKIAWDKTVEV